MSERKLSLGIDLGVTSIGWALVEKDGDEPISIKDMGVRIIPITTDDEKEFTQGNSITKNQKRTTMRTARKGLDRYQLRRKALIKILQENGMMPDRHLMLELSPIEIWGLRAKALERQVSLQELGRIWLHLNQRRGYNHSRHDDAADSKQTEYVKEVNDRYAQIKEAGHTIGQHFYEQLRKYFSTEHKIDAAYRVKEKVFPRTAYIEEFDRIWQVQKQFYPSLLTEDLRIQVRDEIIYYQRRLKSQKGLVGTCEFEGKWHTDSNHKERLIGPKVCPKSSPIFQVEKIWESINNIVVKDNRGEVLPISNEQREKIFSFLNSNKEMTQSNLFSLLGIGKNDGYYTNSQIRLKGLQGNLTKFELQRVLGKEHPLLAFDLVAESYERADKETGEIKERMQIKGDFEKQPLYQLWHCIYSLDESECIRRLAAMGATPEQSLQLARIDMTKGGFGNKSARAIRRILPYLQQSHTYDKACAHAGYNHSDSLTEEENLNRVLKDKLQLIPRNSLRQPIVEKILNQLVNVVNAIMAKHGRIAEIRVELARELRQSKDERNSAYINNNKREKKNKEIEKLLLEHPEFRKKKVSRRDVEKYRLWEEFKMASPYEPNKQISLSELFSGNYDIEHIIPRSLRFDDSFGNKTICHRRFNSGEHAKNNFTAYDYMQSKRSKNDFDYFISFIEKAYAEKRISKTKYENLLCQAVDLKPDFINRQLNETRYIARHAKKMLQQVCYHVYATSGSVTQRLRNLWGWDSVLEQLNVPKYREAGLTEIEDVTHNGQTYSREVIKEWSKRDDHRHHAIDALAIACTSQKFIHRINNLNAAHTRKEMFDQVQQSGYKESLSLLDNYLIVHKPFDTAYVSGYIAAISISFKPGKKVSTNSRRMDKKKKIVQRGIIEPRSALSEESVYGKILRKIHRVVKLDKNFTAVSNIVDPAIKAIVNEWYVAHGGDHAAFQQLKKEPIVIDKEKGQVLTHVEIWEMVPEYVIKYPISSITAKDVEHIVDMAVKEKVAARLREYDDDHKRAWKDLNESPLWLNEEKKIPIKSVRLYTHLSPDSVVPIKIKDNTWDIEYEKYVKPGNNHHIAIYKDSAGKLQEHVVSFWHAVERKKFGLPVVIKDPKEVWDNIFSLKRELPEAFLTKLPVDGWKYITSMQQNECFVFGMSYEDLSSAIENRNYQAITPFVFRVRKLTSGSYWFNQQYETSPRESVADKKSGRCVQASLSSMKGIKVKIGLLGDIHFADEYQPYKIHVK